VGAPSLALLYSQVLMRSYIKRSSVSTTNRQADPLLNTIFVLYLSRVFIELTVSTLGHSHFETSQSVPANRTAGVLVLVMAHRTFLIV
jgi:hypothetical protein